MTGAGDSDRLQAANDRRGLQGVTWPVSAAALDALVDMGLSDDRIGRYFRVDVAEVRRQRERAGASSTTGPGIGRRDESGVAPGKIAG